MITYGLIGKSLAHSFSKNYFNEKFERLGFKISYQNFELADLVNFRHWVFNNRDLIGLNITIPYKTDIIEHLDVLDNDAKEIGAVNTVKIDHVNKKLFGYNTDFKGFKDSLQDFKLNIQKKAIVLGSGGASKGICYALKQLKIQPIVVSRTPKKNELNYSSIDEKLMEESQLIINCTPLGTFPKVDDFPPIPYHLLGINHICYDLIYNPKTTSYMSNASEYGAQIKNGADMLVRQAEASWKIWID